MKTSFLWKIIIRDYYNFLLFYILCYFLSVDAHPDNEIYIHIYIYSLTFTHTHTQPVSLSLSLSFLVRKVSKEATIERRTLDLKFFFNFYKMILAAGERSSEDIGPKERKKNNNQRSNSIHYKRPFNPLRKKDCNFIYFLKFQGSFVSVFFCHLSFGFFHLISF